MGSFWPQNVLAAFRFLVTGWIMKRVWTPKKFGTFIGAITHWPAPAVNGK